jgi:hypothetical protein
MTRVQPQGLDQRALGEERREAMPRLMYEDRHIRGMLGGILALLMTCCGCQQWIFRRASFSEYEQCQNASP